jgi:hypothetical protein
LAIFFRLDDAQPEVQMMERKWWPFACVIVSACGTSGARPAPAPVPAAAPFHIEGAIRGVGTARILNEPRAVRRTIAAPVDYVWRTLPGVYDALGIVDAGADEEAKVFGIVDFRPRRLDGRALSVYVNCGMGITAIPKADEYDVTMSVLTQVKPGGEGETVLATSVVASAKPRIESGNSVYCDSQGTLETRIVDLVSRMLEIAR